MSDDNAPQIEMVILDPRLQQWGLPTYQTDGSAAVDLRACIDAPRAIQAGQQALIPAGIAIHIRNPGIAAVILPRSGMAARGLVLANLIGLLDSDYQGTVTMAAWNRLTNPGEPSIIISPGERIAQMLFVPIVRPSLKVVDWFTEATERGAGGFGSTGAA